jgi:lysophospholipase L1-like esterase
MKDMLRKWSLVVVLLISSIPAYPPVIAESPKEITYIAIGDSLTAGLGSSEENHLRIHGFVPQFTKFLRAENKVTVENYGIPGLSSTGLLALLGADEALQNRLKTSDVISVSIGGNDFLQTIRAVPDGEEDEQALQIKMEILKRTYEEIYSTLRRLNSDAVLILMGVYNPYPAGHELHKLGEEYAPMFNSMLNKYAAEDGTLIVDLFEAFTGRALEFTHIDKNDIHPNDKGYGEIVRMMKEVYLNNPE